MTHLIYILVILAIFLYMCEEESENYNLTDDYFPLKVGYMWNYESIGFHDTICLTREVTDKIEMNGTNYFIIAECDENNLDVDYDTLRKDDKNRIWKYHTGTDYLLFDFTKDEGETYRYPSYSEDFVVSIFLIDSVKTKAGNFKNCLNFFFCIPIYVDSETWYVFAPGVGLVERIVGEGLSFYLTSYNFSGVDG